MRISLVVVGLGILGVCMLVDVDRSSRETINIGYFLVSAATILAAAFWRQPDQPTKLQRLTFEIMATLAEGGLSPGDLLTKVTPQNDPAVENAYKSTLGKLLIEKQLVIRNGLVEFPVIKRLSNQRPSHSHMLTWLQRHDFSIEELSEDREKCLVVLEGFNWEEELLKYEEALEQKQKRSPPGMGFVDGDRVLHIMPVREGKSHVHYTCDHPSRLFALFGANRKLQAWEVPNERRKVLIDLHYAGAQDDLIEALQELGA